MQAVAAAAAATGPEQEVHVALHQYNEVVTLNPLPLDSADVIELLSAEAAPIPVWLDAAKAFMAQHNLQACEAVLRDALTPDVIDGIRQLYHKEPTFELVQLHCALAAVRLEESKVNRDASVLAAAAQHADQARKISGSEMLPDMVTGMLELNKNNSEAALAAFKVAARKFHNGRKNHAPLLAQASVHFNNGNIAEAHHLYAQVLRENPSCPAEVRLGLAACLYRGGRLERAKAAYNRVLELDPNRADALLGLAMVAFGSTDASEGLNSGLQLLRRAYDADNAHAGVLCVLSHFALLKGQAMEARQLAEAALLSADSNRLREAVYTLLGRCNHALGDFQAAQQNYAQAIRLDPSQPLAHLGTAQVYLAASGEVTNVVSELELVLKALPGNTDAMQLLGGLLSVLPERVSRAMEAHKDVIKSRKDDLMLQEYVGDLLAASDPASSLEAFTTALSLHREKQAAALKRNEARARKRQLLLDLQQSETAAAAAAAEGGDGGGDGSSSSAAGAAGAAAAVAEAQALLDELGPDEEVPVVPAKLLNNTAVLLYRSGQSSRAVELMAEATQNMMVDGTTPAMHKITMGYNLARLQEASGDLKAASKAYQELVQQFPGYIDCYLRLSALARAAGDMDKAREWADAATQQAGGDVDAQALLATLYLQRGDNQAARNCISKAEASAPEAKRDPYLRLTHANVIMAMLPTGRYSSLKEGERQKHHECIQKALGLYREVLKLQPGNIYAVNGIGTCLAELGHLTAAKEAFNEVIRATSRTKGFVKLPEAYVNMGHLGLAKKQHADALRMYELASREGGGGNGQRDVKALTLIARAHHDAAEHMEARRALQRGLHQFPTDMKLRFNLGFVLQEHAMKLFKREHVRGDPEKLQDFRLGLDAIKQAGRIFSHLLSVGAEGLHKGGLEIKKVTMHAQFCEDKGPQFEVLVGEAEKEVAYHEAEKRNRQAQLTKAEAERQYQEAARAAAAQAEKQRKDAEAMRALKESHARVEQLKEQWKTDAAGGGGGGGDGGDGGKKGGGKKRKKGGAAAADESFYVGDDAPIERLPKKNTKAEYKRAGLDSDEDEEGDAAHYNEGGSDDADDAADADVDKLFGGGSEDEDGGGGGSKKQQQKGGGGGGSGGGGGRLRRRAAAADEQMGESTAGGAEGGDGDIGGLFDEEMEDVDQDEDAGQQQQQQQPRKRMRQQTLGDDDDEDEEADAAAGVAEGDGEAAAAEGAGEEGGEGGDAGAAAEGGVDELDDLF